MVEDVKLSRLNERLETLTYPLVKEDALSELRDIRVQFADGAERLNTVVERSSMDVFVSPGDLQAEIYSHLPVEAVGEPGQSEGEG